ncbi:pentatricopeptide repeat-containing protein CRR2, chloroplastic-like [Phragmites australis]|uniref:pentatricopeptide repeat-containing protein CRR2, chloroplastic-like n=1 Tax=Phragmites australis TaxID=29695 RepID=UPI002D7A38EF|nr:pentatricopeptide repeat-containing protein CRR2, chloroplastic-like [Phragmites australis]
MQRCYSKPRPKDSYDYVSLLQYHGDPRRLAQIHSRVITSGLECDRFVAAGLVARYAALGRAGVAAARQVFDRAPHRDSFLWNVMLRGYARAGTPREALALFARSRAAAAGNRYTYTFVVKACAAVGDGAGRVGQAVHALTVRAGVEPDVFVGNALVAFYARCGDVAMARKVFDGVTEKDVVSWNSIIAGYAQNGHSDEAVALLRSMLRRGADCRPDHVTLVAVLPACAASGAVREGLWTHSYVVSTAIVMNAALASGLIAMYAACGRLDIARVVFERVLDRTQAVYTSMIQAYGSHGQGVEALDMFHQMLANGIAPDGICFVSVLSACAHGGLVDDGLEVFDMMDDHRVEKRQVHYACVVDLLGRAGQLSRALGVVEAMPFEPGRDVWGALLGASRLHGDIELAERAAERLLVLDPGNAGRYAALAQMYDDAGRWDDASTVRTMMRDRGVNKPLASSIVEGDMDA